MKEPHSTFKQEFHNNLSSNKNLAIYHAISRDRTAES
jgi:hypothetical protein